MATQNYNITDYLNNPQPVFSYNAFEDDDSYYILKVTAKRIYLIHTYCSAVRYASIKDGECSTMVKLNVQETLRAWENRAKK